MMGKTHEVGGALAGVIVSGFLYTADSVTTTVSLGTLVFGAMLGSLLPDIDKKESKIGRILWFISWPIYIFRLIIKLLSGFFPGVIKKALQEIDEDLEHRGIAHSLITWSILSAILWIFRLQVLPGLLRVGSWIIQIVLDIIPKGHLRSMILAIGSWITHIVKIDPSLLNKGIMTFVIGIIIGMLSHILLDILTNDGVAIFSPFIDKKISILSINTGSFAETLICGLMAVVTIAMVYKDYYHYIKIFIPWLDRF